MSVKNEICEKIAEYISKAGISQGRLSREIGMTPAVISQYLKNKYKGDVVSLEQSLMSWMKKQESRKASKKVPTLALPSFEKIYNYLGIAHEDKTISFIVGPAGMGKTTALKAYAKENSNVYVVEGESGLTEFSLLRALGHKMGIRAKSTVKLKEDIINTLRDKDAMVIIDEANYLAKGLLDVLRRVVYDQGQTPVAFVGVKDLMTNIFENPRDFQQLQSRVGVYGDFSGSKLEIEEVKMLAQSVLGEVEDRLLKEIRTISGGSLRLVVNLLERCSRVLGINGGELRDDVLDMARNSIFLTAKR